MDGESLGVSKSISFVAINFEIISWFRRSIKNCCTLFSVIKRGWNYVNCIESVVGAQGGRNMKNQCWKMTALCRNVLAGEKIMEPVLSPTTPSSASTVAALIAGLLGSTAIVIAFLRGTPRRRTVRSGWRNDDGDVSFTVVHGRDDSNDHDLT